MQDLYKREIDYIRISVTDRCNLSCVYCKPDGTKQEDREYLTDEEILRLCRCFASLGISRVKITGGEPLLRPHLARLIHDIKALEGIQQVTLTTNGVFLKQQLPDLMEAGLDAVNISLDALEPQCFRQITGRNDLDKVLDSLSETRKYPKLRVKINCVPLGKINDDQLVKLASLAMNEDIHVRFIEMMPIGYGKNFACRTQEEICEVLEQAFGKKMTPYGGQLGNGPGCYYELDGFQGKIGFISALSHKFCDRCNRIRLTSQGFLKACLQYNIGCDLKEKMKQGVSDEQLMETIRDVIHQKPLCHHFGEIQENDMFEQRTMSEIGG